MKAGLKEKGAIFNSLIEEFHGIEIEGPLVTENHFTAVMKMNVTMKVQSRNVDKEVAIFRVDNGKIVSEQFFFEV